MSLNKFTDNTQKGIDAGFNIGSNALLSRALSVLNADSSYTVLNPPTYGIAGKALSSNGAGGLDFGEDDELGRYSQSTQDYIVGPFTNQLLLGPGNGDNTIYANTSSQGDVYELWSSGQISGNIANTLTLDLNVIIGGVRTSISTPIVYTFPEVITDGYYEYKAQFLIGQIGAPGVAISQVIHSIEVKTPSTAFYQGQSSNHTNSTTFETTQDMILNLELDSASAVQIKDLVTTIRKLH